MNKTVNQKPKRCPTCSSYAPHLHPAVQAEGEVHICPDAWHATCVHGIKLINACGECGRHSKAMGGDGSPSTLALALNQAAFTPQELADLRALISIAVWIRSEQIAEPGSMLMIDTTGLETKLCRAQMNAGQDWHKRLTALLGTDEKLMPSWNK